MPKGWIFAVAFLATLQPRAGRPQEGGSALTPRIYPPAPRIEQIDEYNGLRVNDPYRWLEDSDSPETSAWINAENRLCRGYLDSIPERTAIRERLKSLWNYDSYGIPSQRGGRYIYTKRTGLQDQPVLLTARSLTDLPSVLLDPNGWSGDGTVSLADYALSEDGRFLAYGISRGGSDWWELYIRDIETGSDFGDHLRWVKFSAIGWIQDSGGFFYTRYDSPSADALLEEKNTNGRLFFHRIGTAQDEDTLVYARPDLKDAGLVGTVTDDGRYLVIHVWFGSKRENMIFYRDLAEPQSGVVELLNRLDAQYTFLGNDGPIFWFRTDLAAPRGRIVSIDITDPAPEHWSVVIPEQAETMESASLVGDRLIITSLRDARHVVNVYSPDGRFLEEIRLPAIGSVVGFGGRLKDRETFYQFSSFTTPPTVYRYEIETGTSTVFKRPGIVFDAERYETRQVFYSSKDGTRVPMFLTYAKGLQQDGTNPTYLYGYGGFDISMTPYFSISNAIWMEMGGILAVACLRGGGEYGEDWHLAGTKTRKQNVFDDFIAAGEWLIANRYTRTARLAIAGGSNGGLLVGACITQRPDLFGAAIASNGVLDMLRFHRFTIGWAWVSDYGSPENPDEFRALYAYSPLHNVKPGTAYPPLLITTADHDDRVIPAHSYKFAAAMQAAQAGPGPILLRVETEAGHGAGTPTTKLIDDVADRFAFLVRTLGMVRPELRG